MSGNTENSAPTREEEEEEEEEESAACRVVGIKELVDGGLHKVPPSYVRPPHERPTSLDLLPGKVHPHFSIPVLDLANLDGNSHTLSQQLSRACEECGFFQVINHGMDVAVIQRARDAALSFFQQPAKERMRFCSRKLTSSVAYMTTALAEVREWRDALGLTRSPGKCDGFQEAPQICKKELQEYIEGMKELAGRLYKAIFQSLGLEEVPGIPRVLMAINYYPPCPDPTLTLGMSGHCDVNSLTILHLDDVPGLQIKQNGSWIPVQPIDSSAFVVNLADQTEIMTNGKYKSLEHRVLTNSDKARMSIGCFFGPMEDTIVAPLTELLNENNPPRFKATKFKDYVENFAINKLLADRATLDFARV